MVTIQPNSTTVNADDVVRYTVTYSAPDAPVGYPSNGNPAIITANIPDQTTYVAGSATETVDADAEYQQRQRQHMDDDRAKRPEHGDRPALGAHGAGRGSAEASTI